MLLALELSAGGCSPVLETCNYYFFSNSRFWLFNVDMSNRYRRSSTQIGMGTMQTTTSLCEYCSMSFWCYNNTLMESMMSVTYKINLIISCCSCCIIYPGCYPFKWKDILFKIMSLWIYIFHFKRQGNFPLIFKYFPTVV